MDEPNRSKKWIITEHRVTVGQDSNTISETDARRAAFERTSPMVASDTITRTAEMVVKS